MFHILKEGTEVLKADSQVLCGVNIRRAAISLNKFKAGIKNRDRCCKKCLQAAERRFRPQTRVEEVQPEQIM